MKVQIKSIEIKQFEKEGKRYEMAFLEYGDQKVSMYLHPTYGAKDKEKIQQWAPGMEVDIIVYQSNGYTNFKLPTKADLVEEELNKLKRVVSGMYQQLVDQGLLPRKNTQPVAPQQPVQQRNWSDMPVVPTPEGVTPEQEINVEEIPF